MQCKLKSKLDPPSQSAPRPPTLLFPRELWPLVSAGSHRVWLVVASWLQWATTTCSGIVVGGRPLCPPLAPPTTTHPLKPQRNPGPTSKADHDHRPQAASSQNGRAGRAAVPFGHFYNPLRCSESSWAVRAGGPSRNPPVCGCPLWPRTAHNGGHGKHEAAAGTTGPPQPTATPPQRGSGEPATTHRSAAAEECALQPPEVEHHQQQQQQ